MGIYVPAEIKELEDGSFHGSFPFDSSFEVTGTRSRVVRKIYGSAAGYIQNTKCPNFLELMREHRKKGYCYFKVDLFSGFEHFFFGLVSLVLGVFLFSTLISAAGFIYLHLSDLGAQTMGEAANAQFVELTLNVSLAEAIVFILLWNVFWTVYYPKCMQLYGSVLLLSENVRTLHLSMVTRICNLFQAKPYWYTGEES
ncbi:hypothetical protein HOF92_02170 [bacterium]|jgi:hypothetical protein|nr:hypothetical protein [bacterium]